jgi:transposase-like protein
MFKRIPVETKNEILSKVKAGQTVVEVAKQYAVSTKTIYAWLANETMPDISILEYNRLKRENEELKRIIGLITLELERGKKNRHC